MNLQVKYDKLLTGIMSGLILPLIIMLIIFLFAKGNSGLSDWLDRIVQADIITHIVSLSVFPNVIIFLLFNYFDMLRAAKGVLGITIVWAIIVFGIKILI